MGQLLQSLVERVISPHDREEQGRPPVMAATGGHGHEGNGGGGADMANPQQRPQPRRALTIIRTDADALVPQNDKLLVFRSLTGIDTVPALTSSGHAGKRAAENVGIYTRVVRAEKMAARSYRLFNIAINVCLGIQFIMGAALTALGAADGSRATITAFGAINTIIAGILTYLKGSGLPDRFKRVEEEFKMVREYVEQREREFCLAGCPLDPFDEVQAVDDMYKAAAQQLSGGGNKTPGTNAVQPQPRVVTTAPSSLAHRLTKPADPPPTHVLAPCERQHVSEPSEKQTLG
ncbi:C6 transcription factor [Hirsutella rhossiliensis]|uniref:C6 transcription factor n=1 Tax=Hirsutella rhossiliensis TaxID=111463 RepID=A0A9P8SLC5_9HYPO|nr:C6 transcription factor [Hirsutella rhossiliensis]KAH0966109.1 C6 transcription factor [Hirsutella rhossiliensis]